MSSQLERRIAAMERAINPGDGVCRCPGTERFVAMAHVDSRGVLWYTNRETCAVCGGSTRTPGTEGNRVTVIRFDADTAPIEELPFGGYDRWFPWGPPPGRTEEIEPTGVADEVERTRTEPGEWSRAVFVPIAELLEA